MKIAVFSDSFYPQVSGVVTSIINSSQQLAARGHEILIFVPEGKFRKPKLNKRIKIIPIKSFALPAYEEYRVALPQMIKCLKQVYEFRPDIIHIHTPFSLGIMGLMCAVTYKVPMIGTYHTIFPEFLKYRPLPGISDGKLSRELTWGYTNFVYDRCCVVTTPSYTMANELISHGIKAPIKVISNGIDLSKFQKENNKGILKKYHLKSGYLLHFGRLSHEKDIGTVLKAFRLALREYPELRLVVAGKGPASRTIKEHARAMGISKHVTFTGFIPEKELPGLISMASIFLTASTIETQGLVVLEAMACELPVIGVKSLAVPELVIHGKNGFIVEPHDYKSMSLAITKLLGSEKLRKKMCAQSLKTARAHSLEKTTQELERLYSSKINAQRRRKSLRKFLFWRQPKG